MIRVQPEQAAQASAAYITQRGPAVLKPDLYLAAIEQQRKILALEAGFNSVEEWQAAQFKANCNFFDRLLAGEIQ